MPNNDDLPLDDLLVFLAVVREGGFRAAAGNLARAPSTVSETITRLETRLGTPLFTRSTRSVRPTEAGAALAARLAPVMDDARAAIEAVSVSADSVSGPLRLNVPKAVMIDILPPLIDRFLERYPEVTVEIMVEDSFVDSIAAGCHAGIRYDEALELDMISVPLGPPRQRYALAASPDYLARNAAPEHPDDVLAHECLLLRFSGGALVSWVFERGAETRVLTPPARLTLTAASAESLIGHALSGRGLIHVFANWITPHFETGALVPLLPDWWAEFSGPRLYYPNRRAPAPLRAFIDLVAQERKLGRG
ncbi:MAG: LysR family transcriptional regulator [Rhodobacteraceae bacterium]|nr:LysR family transcriptional regulator [Paracoccaceae bacterium]MBR9822982.1 LysR family transcriptional regulator [Paracoccaceae bacterium]